MTKTFKSSPSSEHIVVILVLCRTEQSETAGGSLTGLSKVGVIGAGTMGHGIAQVFAQAGFSVKLNDISEDFINNGIKRIGDNLSRSVSKGKLSEAERRKPLQEYVPALDLSEFADRELVVEAALEKIEVKSELFKRLDKICSKDAILASNTSSIPITQLAALVTNPDESRWNAFLQSGPSHEARRDCKGDTNFGQDDRGNRAVSVKLGKTAVLVADSAGFISNRILCPMINEAVFALEEGIATKEDIDTVMKLGMNHPMGPLELADFVGLDVLLDVLDVLYREFQDPKYRASPLLRRMVRAGYLGRKTKKGFYDYPYP